MSLKEILDYFEEIKKMEKPAIKEVELEWKSFKRENSDVIEELIIHATGGGGYFKVRSKWWESRRV